jgi:hypothetical protein
MDVHGWISRRLKIFGSGINCCYSNTRPTPLLRQEHRLPHQEQRLLHLRSAPETQASADFDEPDQA